jgi:two-component system phosphate regulon sensor histidine kinase PhoR
MKINRTHIFIATSSLALIVLLLIQVNWIFKTARIKEALFNEKANMVLARTTEALNANADMCEKIEASMDNNGSLNNTAELGEKEKHEIDSIVGFYMKFYDFYINYTFDVTKPDLITPASNHGLGNYMYCQPLEKVESKNKVNLRLILPDKRKFIIAEMGPMFITSVVLILVVLVLFWRTLLSLMKEKKISEHTTEFLNNMTHEFKTPLTNIALAGKMIHKNLDTGNEDKLKHYTGIILEENEKLTLQVEQMLGMTALERGEIVLRTSRIDLHALIQASANRVSIQLENLHGQLTLELHAANHWIMGDAVHMNHVLDNLIDNAIKYSPHKTLITIETLNLGKDLVIKISDHGIGIEKEYQKQVFDKFFRVPTGDVHNVKGFGIGLAYVKKLIELHKGSIELESEKGKGTTFTIRLAHA